MKAIFTSIYFKYVSQLAANTNTALMEVFPTIVEKLDTFCCEYLFCYDFFLFDITSFSCTLTSILSLLTFKKFNYLPYLVLRQGLYLLSNSTHPHTLLLTIHCLLKRNLIPTILSQPARQARVNRRDNPR